MTRQHLLRQLTKQIVPKPLLIEAWARYCRFRSRHARRIFEDAPATPSWLGWTELDALQHAYPLDPMTYRYDAESLKTRGRERARTMLNYVKSETGRLCDFLDLGMWDGMTCLALQEAGKSTVGVDIRVEGLDERARAGGSAFAGMDAARLGFRNESFDFVFSFNSFEHFPNPEAVLQEALRVLRPGGYLYLDFGPLWLSPKGAHQFQNISVPYVECLFTKELLTDYATANDIRLMGFFWMNEWPLSRYRRLWEQYAGQLDRMVYYETYNADHVNLTKRYPTCFKNKTQTFDDLIVSNIEVLFRKR
jgi:SAM-dependent methyltransferase